MGNILNVLLYLFLVLIVYEVYGARLDRSSDRKRSQCPYVEKRAAESKVQRNRRDTCKYTQPTCKADEKYRSVDGSCNNLVTNTLWGRADTPDVRFLPNNYQDGISKPTTLTNTNAELPIARVVSTKVLQDDTFADFSNHRLTHMLMQWGQFLDHDITRTPTVTETDGTEPICCVDDLPAGSAVTQTTLDAKDECFAMPITARDRHFSRSCMNFVRSVQTTPLDCSEGVAEQVNLVTHYIDASQVYGSSEEEMTRLRNGSTGYLKISENNLLPHVDEGVHCVTENDGDFCFDAGDVRVNVQPGLMAIQTLFMREHNRIAKDFYDHTTWDGDKIFYETRKILGALIQHITYNEFLPVIMGDVYDDGTFDLKPTASGFNNVYNSIIDPSIRTEFATAAYRFGHSMIQSHFTRNFGSFNESTLLRSLYGRTKYIAEDNGDGMNRIINGLLIDVPEKADRWYSLEITDRLFEKSEGDALDLGALNVQRGRDHGQPTYNDFREFCGFVKASTFAHGVSGGLLDHIEVPALRLQNTYEFPDDIDLYPGAVSERPVRRGALGPTFVCMLGHQFEALRKGDRFWYENNNSITGFTEDFLFLIATQHAKTNIHNFPPSIYKNPQRSAEMNAVGCYIAQLNSIKGMTLSRVICDNTDITFLVQNAFEQPNRRNSQVQCSTIAGLDLSRWY